MFLYRARIPRTCPPRSTRACRMGLVALLTAAPASALQPTLEQIMADPDWIGNAPESPYFSDDGKHIYYRQKRTGETVRDLYRLAATGGAATRISTDAHPIDSGRDRVYDPQRTAAVWINAGDVYLKELGSGEITRLSATPEDEAAPLFSADGRRVYFLRDTQFWMYDRDSGELLQHTDVRAGDNPAQAPAFDTLRAHQARTYSTLVESERREQFAKMHARQQARRATSIYLGEGRKVVRRALSPNGQYLALVVIDASHDAGQAGTMPNYVTLDGYVANLKVRTRVGRNVQADQSLLLVNLDAGELIPVSLEKLPGLDTDPLASLRREALAWHVQRGAEREAVATALKAPDRRGLTLQALRWSPDGAHLAVQAIANDYKDRWLFTLAPDDSKSPKPALQHRLTDPAWINWKHNEFGWLPQSEGLWYLSEETGYSHLYRIDLGASRPHSLTRGEFVVSKPALGPRGQYIYLVANRAHPGNHRVYRVPLAGGELSLISDLDGVSEFRVSPDGEQLLVSRSWIDRHPDLYLGASDGSGEMTQVTDTVSDAYRAIDWTIPEIVQVPSSHTDRPIYAKLYLPAEHDPQQRYPAVMFVHGAGYTQNAHMGWPYYFREFMFHTYLNRAGYVVLDLDYRGSEGYGRDWRTTIYRNMGHPELEDYLDGIDYLVQEHGVARERVGIYGGSYGGFMTFMALFRAPEAFAAGAALRPVADWMHYENDYTRRILNTPLVDPVAYQRSSPINHAEGLQSPLLIAAGMQDSNVFFQDSVLVVQRLLELKKPDFEIAIYPLDGHAFTHPESWLDEYRRIFRLMQDNLKPTQGD